MNNRSSIYYCVALLPLAVVMVLSELHRDGLLQRISLMLLTTVSA